MRFPNWVSAWFPVALWLVLIGIESTATMGAGHTREWLLAAIHFLHVPVLGRHIDALNFILRKCGHFVGYGVLGVLFARAFLMISGRSLAGRPLMSRAVAFALLTTALVASADEIHQRYLPGRGPAVHDVLLDCTGAAILIFVFSRKLREVGLQHNSFSRIA